MVNNENIQEILECTQKLQGFLKTEMSVSEPEEGRVIAELRVYNDAPPAVDGSEVVFLGVGLVIIDGRERSRTNWTSRVIVSGALDHDKQLQRYNKGEYISARQGKRFPAYTDDEASHGEILFPGENLVYEVEIAEDELPYFEIWVDGSVSRRHLLHISRQMKKMEKWSLPLVAETFQALDEIDLYSPLISMVGEIPAFNPQTTLADIDSFRGKLEKAIGHVKDTMPELNKVYHTAPNQELRDLMKQHIGYYLTTSQRMCNKVLETLSGSNTELMKESAEELKAHLLTLEEVKKAKAETMSQFDIKPD